MSTDELRERASELSKKLIKGDATYKDSSLFFYKETFSYLLNALDKEQKNEVSIKKEREIIYKKGVEHIEKELERNDLSEEYRQKLFEDYVDLVKVRLELAKVDTIISFLKQAGIYASAVITAVLAIIVWEKKFPNSHKKV